MAGATLLVKRLFGIKPRPSGFFQPQLVMGIVAVKTMAVCLGILYSQSAMNSLIHVFRNIVMTSQTMIHMKEPHPLFIHIIRIRMGIPLDVLVTILAGNLTVGRNMKFFTAD